MYTLDSVKAVLCAAVRLHCGTAETFSCRRGPAYSVHLKGGGDDPPSVDQQPQQPTTPAHDCSAKKNLISK